MFAQQREFVPVFIKASTNAWTYAGDYRVARIEEDPATTARHATLAGRNDVSMELHLEGRDS